MPRRYGYAPVGPRCCGTCDWHARGRTSAIRALLGLRLIAVGWFGSSVNAEAFLARLCQVLSPQPPPATVIVLDHAAFHKRADIQDTFRQAGHTLAYPPPY